MKIDDAQKLEIYRTTLAAIVSRGGAFPTTTPPARDGSVKEVSKAFAVAAWAAAITRAAVYVLTREESSEQGAPEGSGQGGSETPF